MDASSMSGDDLSDYDVISTQSDLECSLADLQMLAGRQGADLFEPPPVPAAQRSFPTIGWSARDIQAFVRTALGRYRNENAPAADSLRCVRVYVDGLFDGFDVGYALQLRQAKLAFPCVHLMVGVFSDDLCDSHGVHVTYPHLERCEALRHCRWVDEVVTDAPWEIDAVFLRQQQIDYVAVDEGMSVDPACDKIRLRGYDLVKSMSKCIPTRRTLGVTRLSARKLESLAPSTTSTPIYIRPPVNPCFIPLPREHTAVY
ncbi:hypothetical protein FISHEDRAFT_34147 [Fistulina hepatica ATCC 64428]|uniref:choline-phosphate cytidylyltransferase n=1 Tax=Fistulina hepatica ATCC 64428 TaxID=1128425 RepID=A0A0D7AMM3_9AGAR|nr:hypothetical protein FISHEDRAFT_34147 [Fistulina hepatica ATCC 64428]